MLNLLNNDNKYESQFNNEMFKHIKKNEINKIKNKKDINFIGKELNFIALRIWKYFFWVLNMNLAPFSMR